jgi:hypothetical protein
MSVTKAKTDNITSLDASQLTGTLPVISGANLTGLQSITKNASDPAIGTNPSGGVGTLWANTTSGEMFACTDATAGSNIWINIGAGSGDVQPFSFRGSIAGFTVGGTSNTVINKTSFTSDGNATSHGNITAHGTNTFVSGVSSVTHGYTTGGGGYVDVIDKYAFAGSAVTATDVGNLTYSGMYTDRMATASDGAYGFTMGGEHPPQANIHKINFASDSDSVDYGFDITQARYGLTGCSSSTHGYGVSGIGSSVYYNIIDKFSFSSAGAATDVGDVTVARHSPAGGSSTTHGYCAAGYNSSSVNTNVVDKFAFSSNGNSVDVTDLTRSTRHVAGSSSTTHGYVSGGIGSSDVIDKYSFSNNNASTDVGNLIAGLDGPAAHQY